MSFDYNKFHDEVFWCCERINPLECPECEGYGETMYMVCYGGPPQEHWDVCELCVGYGNVDNHDVPVDWAQEWLAGSKR